MRARLLELIVCPGCGGSFRLDTTQTQPQTEGDEIITGRLTCQRCSTGYPIERGVPLLLPSQDTVSDAAQRTVDRFGEQWNDFDFIGPHYERQFLQWIAPNTPETFRGQIVLEGGCGKGRHSALASRFGAKDVIAVDLGSAVDAAYRNTRAYPNVHVVQADLFHLPVAPGSVDLAFSVGVLHHTPDPHGAFKQLVGALRPGGRVIAWVYGRENNAWIVHGVSPLREKLTSRLPHKWVYQLSRVPAAVLYAIGKGVYEPLSRPPFQAIGDHLFYHEYVNYISKFPFKEVHSIVHDHLTPPIAHYLPREEFEAWFREAELDEVVIGWHNQNSWRGTGLRRAKAETEAKAG